MKKKKQDQADPAFNSGFIGLSLGDLAVEDFIIFKLDAYNVYACIQTTHINLINSCGNINYL